MAVMHSMHSIIDTGWVLNTQLPHYGNYLFNTHTYTHTHTHNLQNSARTIKDLDKSITQFYHVSHSSQLRWRCTAVLASDL